MARIILVLVMVGLAGIASPVLSQELSVPVPAPAAPAAGSMEQGFRIGAGDVLEVSVWKDETLTRSCVVRPDGFISFPLVGDVSASGKTVAALKSELEGKLKRFVPEVTLFIDAKQINSLVIYVIGKVNTPGRVLLGVDVNILQALATAGGLNPFAKGRKIKIVRHGSSETTIFPFNYDEVVDGEHLEQNIHLKRGDVVVVP